MATLFHQHSAERNALSYQAFNWASRMIDESKRRLGDPRKSAVIVDIDETILDNSPYQADCILENYTYPEAWKDWVDLADCNPLPGALEFVKYAESSACEVFYVTNRKEMLMDPTLENLAKHGFPFADEEHLLMRTDENSKEKRRNIIAKDYHIILLIGDNLDDFVNIFENLNSDARKVQVDSLRSEFGFRYIILPNAMYGSWESAIYEYKKLSASEKLKLSKNILEGF